MKERPAGESLEDMSYIVSPSAAATAEQEALSILRIIADEVGPALVRSMAIEGVVTWKIITAEQMRAETALPSSDELPPRRRRLPSGNLDTHINTVLQTQIDALRPSHRSRSRGERRSPRRSQSRGERQSPSSREKLQGLATHIGPEQMDGAQAGGSSSPAPAPASSMSQPEYVHYQSLPTTHSAPLTFPAAHAQPSVVKEVLPAYRSPGARLHYYKGSNGRRNIVVTFPDRIPEGIMEAEETGKRGKERNKASGKGKTIWYDVDAHGGWHKTMMLAGRHVLPEEASVQHESFETPQGEFLEAIKANSPMPADSAPPRAPSGVEGPSRAAGSASPGVPPRDARSRSPARGVHEVRGGSQGSQASPAPTVIDVSSVDHTPRSLASPQLELASLGGSGAGGSHRSPGTSSASPRLAASPGTSSKDTLLDTQTPPEQARRRLAALRRRLSLQEPHHDTEMDPSSDSDSSSRADRTAAA